MTGGKWARLRCHSALRQTENDPRNSAVIKLEDVRLNTLMEAKTFEKPESTVRDFRFEKGTNSAQIAFDQIGKTIYVSARINNSRPMWFLLDTGAGASLIDARRARTLGLKSEGKAAMEEAATAKSHLRKGFLLRFWA